MNIQKIVIEKFGKAKELKLKEFQLDTSLRPNEVLIETYYSGLNFADIMMRMGMYKDAPKRPFTPGYEVSGKVIKMGQNVTTFQIGDYVLAGTRFGGYSSHVKVVETQVLRIPDFLDLKKGAAIAVNFMTAHLALNEIARVKSGDKVLIDCATGCVGTIFLQILRDKGIRAYGLTRSETKKEIITSLGADAMTKEEFNQSDVNGFSFILHTTLDPKELKLQKKKLRLGGHMLFMGMSSAIKDGKRSLTTVIKNFMTLSRFSPISLMMDNTTLSGLNALTYFDEDGEVAKAFQALKKADYFNPLIGGVYSYKDCEQAHIDLENGKAKGKLILDWKN